jgi:UDP-N-acetyl-D-mannosaminuronic acid dehydrogenase
MHEKGARVIVHDPYVMGDRIEKDLDKSLQGADAVVVFTGHSEYRFLDPEHMRVKRPLPVIVDGRNIVDPDRFIYAGWIYKGIGRGDKNDHLLDVHV